MTHTNNVFELATIEPVIRGYYLIINMPILHFICSLIFLGDGKQLNQGRFGSLDLQKLTSR